MPRLLHSFMYPVQKISLKLLMVHHYLRLLIKDRRNDCTINFKKTKIFIPTNSARYSNTKKFRHFQFYLEGIIIEYIHKRKKTTMISKNYEKLFHLRRNNKNRNSRKDRKELTFVIFRLLLFQNGLYTF